MSNPPGEFIWYELMTTDSDAAERFYASILGWNVRPSGMPGMDYRLLFAGDNGVGGLMQLGDDMLANGAQPGWKAFISVADPDATAAAVTAAGGSVLVPPTDIPNVGRFAMIQDPGGVSTFVLRSDSDQPSHSHDMQLLGHCAWNELVSSAQDAAIDFFCELFGWERGDAIPIGSLGTYQMMAHNDKPVCAIMRAGPEGSGPMWRYYFRVASLKTAMDAISFFR
jgi:predicted enzyme related to lactoylglutathione lyase